MVAFRKRLEAAPSRGMCQGLRVLEGISCRLGCLLRTTVVADLGLGKKAIIEDVSGMIVSIVVDQTIGDVPASFCGGGGRVGVLRRLTSVTMLPGWMVFSRW